MTTSGDYQPTLFETTELETSTASREDSRARIYRWLEAAAESMATDLVCGPRCTDLFASYDRDGCSWKTSQVCLFTGPAEYSETWPIAGTIADGNAYRQQPWVLLTDEIAFGSLPTPAATDYGSNKSVSDNAQRRPSLVQIARIPTPTQGDARRSGSRNRVSNAKFGISLTDWVENDGGKGRMWPTPAARDHRLPNAKPYSERGGGTKGEQLVNAVAQAENPSTLSNGGGLNPEWVEWLMAYPIGWTASEVWATRSFRRSRRFLQKQS